VWSLLQLLKGLRSISVKLFVFKLSLKRKVHLLNGWRFIESSCVFAKLTLLRLCGETREKSISPKGLSERSRVEKEMEFLKKLSSISSIKLLCKKRYCRLLHSKSGARSIFLRVFSEISRSCRSLQPLNGWRSIEVRSFSLRSSSSSEKHWFKGLRLTEARSWRLRLINYELVSNSLTQGVPSALVPVNEIAVMRKELI